MEVCQSLIERQQYSEALSLVVQHLADQYPTPNLEIIQLLNSILTLSPNYKKFQIQILKLLKWEDDKEELFSTLFLQLIQLYVDQDLLQEAQQSLFEFKQIIQQQSIQSNSLNFMLEQISQMIKKNQQLRNVDHTKEESEIYEKLREEEQVQKYFEYDGLFAYLIPTSWFRRWQKFVTDKDEIIQDDQLSCMDKSGIEELRRLLKMSDESVVEEDSNYPGPIDGSKLLQFSWNLVIDNFEPKKYTNYVLRENLREGEDFIMVGQKTYKFFSDLYGSFEVKRMIVENMVNKQKYVDLLPRIVNLVILPANTLNLLQISAKSIDNIQEFSKKIRRSQDVGGQEIRWWKFKDLNAQNDWIGKVQKGSLVKTMQAKILDDKMTTDDLNLSQNDIFICEIRREKDWLLHEDIKQMNQVNQKNNHFDRYQISDVPRMFGESRKGITGLQNLGNTCFMNAALQCLSNTYELTEYMIQNRFVNDLNPNNPLGTKGQMAVNYGELMKTMWYGNNSSVSAYELKKTIGRFAPQFYGYGQQDSHEFLSYLLDGLHEDLNRIINKPLVTDIDITNETDNQASDKFWLNYTLRNQSKIQELMVGQYKSTLVCPKCKRISKTFDPFMSLSLPIPSYQSVQFTLYLIFQETETIPAKITLTLTSDMSAKDILQSLQSLCNVDPNNLNMLLIREHQIKERVQLNQSLKYLHEHDGIVFVEEVEKSYFNLSDDDVHIDINYMIKPTKIYESEKLLTFPRQFVMNIQDTIQQLYSKTYAKFRLHFILAVKELSEKEFPFKNDFLQLEKPTDLDGFYQELKVLKDNNKMPFILRIKTDKSKPIEVQMENLQQLGSFGKKLTVDVFINETYLKNTALLKLQRCKETPLDPKSSRSKKGEYSIDDCLRAFTKEEILGKGDEWYCNKCKLHVQASKKMEIYRAPKILIIHLKRFKTNRINNFGNYYFSGGSQKITSLVTFPPQLDLNTTILSKQQVDPIDYIYDLYAVDNHFGGLGGGHYTACARNPILQKWIDFNDSSARATNSDVISEAAYVLFYRRRDSEICTLK